MNNFENAVGKATNRRLFLKNGIAAAGVATVGATGLLAGRVPVAHKEDEKSGNLTKGDAAILRFLAAAEILETDLWVQYNELGGVQDSEVPGGEWECTIHCCTSSPGWGYAPIYPRQY